MRPHEVEFSAYNADTEPSRIDRLHRVLDVCGEEIKNITASVHDHKGTLYVDLMLMPTSQQICDFVNAWRTQGEYLVNFYINKMPFLCDAPGENPFTR